MKRSNLYVIVALFLCAACNNLSKKESTDQSVEVVGDEETITNPPLPGFNAAASDEKAIAIADEVMKAMGGRKAWDDMKTLSWNFFGARKLVWDKPSGNVRIDVLNSNEPLSIQVNVKDSTKVALEMGGVSIDHPDSLAKYGRFGKAVWINDSYWVVMPFKLKDSGVSLNYVREDTTQTGEPAHILQLTFEGVGNTPENKYEIYVSKERNLVAQWAFFRTRDQEEPSFNRPWDNYQDFNGLLLSTERGSRDISELSVTDSPEEGTFSF